MRDLPTEATDAHFVSADQLEGLKEQARAQGHGGNFCLHNPLEGRTTKMGAGTPSKSKMVCLFLKAPHFWFKRKAQNKTCQKTKPHPSRLKRFHGPRHLIGCQVLDQKRCEGWQSPMASGGSSQGEWDAGLTWPYIYIYIYI